MYAAELQALGAVDGHQPHRVEMLRGRRQLAQVAIIAEADKPAHTIEQARDRQPASGRLDPHEVEKLPDRDAARAIGEIPDVPRRAAMRVRSSSSVASTVQGEAV